MRMRMPMLVLAMALSTIAWGEPEFSQAQAQSIAERSATEHDVTLSDYTLAQARREPSGEWSFVYRCVSKAPGCQFVAIVNSATGRVLFTAELEERKHPQISARTGAALASKTPETCAANGGTWFEVGMARGHLCDISAPDAGKLCTDSSQCESECLSDGRVVVGTPVTGHCDEWHHRIGRCVNYVKNGLADGGVCVD